MKIYWHNGRKNVIGPRVRKIRKGLRPKMNQRNLAEALQLQGYEFDRATISRIETGSRFVADYEVKALAEALGVAIKELYKEEDTK